MKHGTGRRTIESRKRTNSSGDKSNGDEGGAGHGTIGSQTTANGKGDKTDEHVGHVANGCKRRAGSNNFVPPATASR